MQHHEQYPQISPSGIVAAASGSITVHERVQFLSQSIIMVITMTAAPSHLLPNTQDVLPSTSRGFRSLWLVGVIWLVNYVWNLLYWNTWYSHNGIDISIFRLALLGVLDWSFWLFAAPLTLWLARRYPPVRAKPVFVVHLPLSALCAVGAIVLSSYMRILIEPVDHSGLLSMVTARLYTEGSWYFLFYWFVVGVYFAVDYHAAYRESVLKHVELQFNNERLQRRLIEAKLSTLRAQLQPHFLFNALHSVSSLMDLDVPKARTMLIDLAELLRLTLEISELDDHSIANEFDWIERYLKLQAVRFGGQLSFEIDLDPEVKDIHIPCFVIQPLVENALNHGAQSRLRESSDHARIKVAAFSTNDNLVIEVADNGTACEPDDWKEGYGLKFVRETLDGYTYGKATMTLQTSPEGGSQAQVTMPLYADA